LLLRLRPIGLALRATPAASLRNGNFLLMSRPPLLFKGEKAQHPFLIVKKWPISRRRLKPAPTEKIISNGRAAPQIRDRTFPCRGRPEFRQGFRRDRVAGLEPTRVCRRSRRRVPR